MENTSPLTTGSHRHRCWVWLLSLSAGACMTGPLNGTTDPATSVIGHAVSYAGYDNTPGTVVTVQVLDDPETQDPNVDTNWVNVGTAVTSTNPFYWNDPANPLYQWSLTAAPVASLAQAGRWPQGGVMRVRAKTHNGLAVVFDEDFTSCFVQHASEPWENIGIACASSTAGAVANGAANVANIVSTSPNPTDVTPSGTRARYLSKQQCLIGQTILGPAAGTCSTTTAPKGVITQFDTLNYYATINAPGSLNCFKTVFGFGGNGNIFDCGLPWLSFNNDLAEAIYYNNADLGLGRRMRCRSFVSNNLGGNRPGVACYVSNYSTQTDSYLTPRFGVDPNGAMAQAVMDKLAGNEAHAFATVAMVYLQPASATDPNSVRFMVYGANGQLTTEAKLDSTAFNTAVPTNCMVCHGGSGTFTPSTSSVTGAQFLPFDTDGFLFSSASPASDKASQAASFRALNNLVLATNPPQAERDFILGMYGGNMASGTFHSDYVPPGFTGSSTAKRVYNEVVKPYCRTCHISQVGDPLFSFANMVVLAPVIKADVCGTKSMPQAEQALNVMWRSPARAHLIGGLNLITSCKP